MRLGSLGCHRAGLKRSVGGAASHRKAEDAMRTEILVCEYATAHPDGTYTVVRGGMEKIPAVPKGQQMQMCFFVLLAHEPAEAGKHKLELKIVDADGRPAVGPALKVNMTFPAERARVFMHAMASTWLAPGAYDAHCLLDGQIAASASFSVVSTAKTKGATGRK